MVHNLPFCVEQSLNISGKNCKNVAHVCSAHESDSDQEGEKKGKKTPQNTKISQSD